MWFDKQRRLATVTLGLLPGLAPAAHAATITFGDLYFTTYQNQSGNGPNTTNVWKVHFVYDSVTGLSLLANTAIKTLQGADGIIFDPNDPTKLLIGEQNSNKVA